MENMDNILCGVFFGGILGMLSLMFILNFTGNTYMDGQIDAINGEIHYELVHQPDGATEWEFKKE